MKALFDLEFNRGLSQSLANRKAKNRAYRRALGENQNQNQQN